MKNFLHLLFKPHKENTRKSEDDLLNGFSFDEAWLTHEFTFQHQQKNYQFRGNSDEPITLGELLFRLFHINKDGLNNLNVNSNGEVTIISDKDKIWQYDIITPSLIQGEDGNYHFSQDLLLSVYYNNGDCIKDYNENMYIIHVTAAGGLNGKSIYSSVTIMSPITRTERAKMNFSPNSKMFTLLVAYDIQSKEDAEKEFYNYMQSIQSKFRTNRMSELTPLEHTLLSHYVGNIQKDIYWGKKKFEEKRYVDSLLYMERAYTLLNDKRLTNHLTQEEQDAMFYISYVIGFCNIELNDYERAYRYLEFAASSGIIEYVKEYIICLTRLKDIHALFQIDKYISELESKKREKWTEEERYFYYFLLRNKSYVLIDMKKYDYAKQLLQQLLKENPESEEYIQEELRYINKLENGH